MAAAGLIFDPMDESPVQEAGGNPFESRRAAPKFSDCQRSGRSSVVEHYLAKVDVDGSSPFARSILILLPANDLRRHPSGSTPPRSTFIHNNIHNIVELRMAERPGYRLPARSIWMTERTAKKRSPRTGRTRRTRMSVVR